MRPNETEFSLRRFFRYFDFKGMWQWLWLGGLIGLGVGIAALVFQFLLQGLSEWCLETLIGASLGHPDHEIPLAILPLNRHFSPWLLVLLPTVGGLITAWLVQKFAPEAEGHGTDAAIKSFHRDQGIIRARVPLIKLLSSIITIGTGGSGGREGPIAQIGAGLGSILASRLGLDSHTRRILLLAGMAAGIGAIFRAPLAAAIFATEVIYSEIELESAALLPAMVASIISYSVFSSVHGFQPIFGHANSFRFSNPLELGPYLILALTVGLGALLYVKFFYKTVSFFAKLPISRYLKPAIGAGLTGLLGLLLLRLTKNMNVLAIMSSGYGILQQILRDDGTSIATGILLLVAVGKIITTSLTIGSGGSAGVFGPSMVIGGTLGTVVGQLFHSFFPHLVPHPGAFMIVGMAGFFSAAANTPLSTMIMVSELTGNYELLIPSMWVCAISFMVARRWSLYKNQVPSKLDSSAHWGEYATASPIPLAKN
jgi:CIC family chloride channel protein